MQAIYASFSYMPTPRTNNCGQRILAMLARLGKGAVVTPWHLAKAGSRRAVDTALSRLVATGKVRRVARGLYDLPRTDRFGPVWPTVDAIVTALAERDSSKTQPTGAYAANRLGLSAQVPMRIVFLTDGLAREVSVGKLTITLRRTTPRNMATAGKTSGLVIQALRWLGKHQVDVETLRKLLAGLGAKARRELVSDSRHAPEWIVRLLRTASLRSI